MAKRRTATEDSDAELHPEAGAAVVADLANGKAIEWTNDVTGQSSVIRYGLSGAGGIGIRTDRNHKNSEVMAKDVTFIYSLAGWRLEDPFVLSEAVFADGTRLIDRLMTLARANGDFTAPATEPAKAGKGK